MDPPRGESASKPDTTAIARRVLNLIDEDELRLRASLGMTAMFVEYVANVKDGASVYRFEVLAGLRSKGRKAEMVLKWLGIGSVRDGRLRDAYSYFEQLSQLDPIGSFYAAMTLAKMGELERGRTVIRALPEHIATHRGLIQDCERLFGSETVTSVLVR